MATLTLAFVAIMGFLRIECDDLCSDKVKPNKQKNGLIYTLLPDHDKEKILFFDKKYTVYSVECHHQSTITHRIPTTEILLCYNGTFTPPLSIVKCRRKTLPSNKMCVFFYLSRRLNIPINLGFEYNCQTGYKPLTNGKAKCNSHIPPDKVLCPKDIGFCRPVDLDEKLNYTITETVKVDSFSTSKCRPGLVLRGNKNITCKFDTNKNANKWKPVSHFKCIDNCGSFFINKKRVTFTFSNPRKIKCDVRNVIIICNKTDTHLYILENTIEKLANPSDICEPKIPICNYTRKHSWNIETKPYYLDQQANVNCVKNYKNFGAKTLTCVLNTNPKAVWDKIDDVECKRFCSVLKEKNDGTKKTLEIKEDETKQIYCKNSMIFSVNCQLQYGVEQVTLDIGTNIGTKNLTYKGLTLCSNDYKCTVDYKQKMSNHTFVDQAIKNSIGEENQVKCMKGFIFKPLKPDAMLKCVFKNNKAIWEYNDARNCVNDLHCKKSDIDQQKHFHVEKDILTDSSVAANCIGGFTAIGKGTFHCKNESGIAKWEYTQNFSCEQNCGFVKKSGTKPVPVIKDKMQTIKCSRGFNVTAQCVMSQNKLDLEIYINKNRFDYNQEVLENLCTLKCDDNITTKKFNLVNPDFNLGTPVGVKKYVTCAKNLYPQKKDKFMFIKCELIERKKAQWDLEKPSLCGIFTCPVIDSGKCLENGEWISIKDGRKTYCNNKNACLGAYKLSQKNEVEMKCNEKIGHYGFLCDNCLPGWYKNNSSCYKCAKPFYKWIILAFWLSFYTMIGFCVAKNVVCLQKLFLSLIIGCHLSRVLHFVYSSRDTISRITIALTGLNFQIDYMLPGCDNLSETSFEALLGFRIGYLVLSFVCFCIPTAIFSIIEIQQKKETGLKLLKRAFLFFNCWAYIGVGVVAIRGLSLYNQPGFGIRHVADNRNTLKPVIVSVSAVLFLAFTIVMPTLISAFEIENKKILSETMSFFSQKKWGNYLERYGFISGSIQETYSFCIPLIFLINFFFILSPLQMGSMTIYANILAAILILSVGFILIKLPFKHNKTNFYISGTILIEIIIILVTSAIESKNFYYTLDSKKIMIILTGINGGLICILILLLIWRMVRSEEEISIQSSEEETLMNG